jgi:hypothetical protein
MSIIHPIVFPLDFQVERPVIIHINIPLSYDKLAIKFKVNTNFDNYEQLSILNTVSIRGCSSLPDETFIKKSYTAISLYKITTILQTLQNEQSIGFKNAYCRFFEAVVYGLNALDTYKSFDSRESMMAYASKAPQMNESFKNYCLLMKSGFANFLKEAKTVISTGHKSA